MALEVKSTEPATGFSDLTFEASRAYVKCPVQNFFLMVSLKSQ